MNIRSLSISLVFAIFLGSTAAIASSPTEAAIAADPVAEKRLQHLSEELRCLVCQNQNIADSNAELGQDLRREISGMIQAGKTDKERVVVNRLPRIDDTALVNTLREKGVQQSGTTESSPWWQFAIWL